MTEVKVEHSAKGSGYREPVAKDLKDVLKNVPDNAPIKEMKLVRGDQRDGTSWVLAAVWDDSVQNTWKPPYGYHKPGMRGTGMPDMREAGGRNPADALGDYREGNPSVAPHDYEGVGGVGSQVR